MVNDTFILPELRANKTRKEMILDMEGDVDFFFRWGDTVQKFSVPKILLCNICCLLIIILTCISQHKYSPFLFFS